MKKKLPAWAVLCIVALIAGGLLGYTNQLTADKIEEQTLAAADAARKSVLPDAEAFEQLELAEGAPVDNCYAGMAGGEAIGYTAQITVKGYGGPIEITVGVDMDGVLTGISVGGSGFAETAGLGAKTKEAAFTSQFSKGLSAPVQLKEDVNAVSGATISSSAVVSGVNKAAEYITGEVLGGNEPEGPEDLVFGGILPGATTSQEEPVSEGVDAIWSSDAGCVVYVTKQGYGGKIQVQVGIAHSGGIAGIRINEEGFSETAGLGARVMDRDFLNQFIGLSGELKIGENIDAVSGATVSSTAVTSAVNVALNAAQPYLDPSKAAPAGEASPYDKLLPGATNVQEQSAPEGADALWTADQGSIIQVTTQGYGGPIEVKAGILADGTIAGIEIGGEGFSETPGLGERVLEDAFRAQFVGKSGTLKIGENVDAVTGATISSTAVVTAVNKALTIFGGL